MSYPIGISTACMPFCVGIAMGTPCWEPSSFFPYGFFFLGPLFLRTVGFVWILMCLVNSSERENLFVHPGNVHLCGFSPVCVLMCLVLCSSLLNALPHIGHLYGRSLSRFSFRVGFVTTTLPISCLVLSVVDIILTVVLFSWNNMKEDTGCFIFSSVYDTI